MIYIVKSILKLFAIPSFLMIHLVYNKIIILNYYKILNKIIILYIKMIPTIIEDKRLLGCDL